MWSAIESMRHHAAKRGAEGDESCVVGTKNVMAFKLTPQLREPFDLFDQRSSVGRQKNGVYRPGGDAGNDLKSQMWEMTRDSSQQAYLICRPSAAAGEDDSEVVGGLNGLIGVRNQFRYAHESSAISKKLPTADLRVMQGTNLW